MEKSTTDDGQVLLDAPIGDDESNTYAEVVEDERAEDPYEKLEEKTVTDMLGDEVHSRYADVKLASAERCPKALGSQIKTSEVQFHHEVTNQYLWSMF